MVHLLCLHVYEQDLLGMLLIPAPYVTTWTRFLQRFIWNATPTNPYSFFPWLYLASWDNLILSPTPMQTRPWLPQLWQQRFETSYCILNVLKCSSSWWTCLQHQAQQLFQYAEIYHTISAIDQQSNVNLISSYKAFPSEISLVQEKLP